MDGAPVQWYSKPQNTVEAATFGSEFIAARVAMEIVEALRYKLRMMGIPIIGPTTLPCDNQSVVTSSTRPESTLSKKHNSIAYHRVREVEAAETVPWATWRATRITRTCLPKLLWGSNSGATDHWI